MRVNPMLFGTNLHANDESGEPIKVFIRDIGLSLYCYPDGGGYYYLHRPIFCWRFPAQIKGLLDRMFCLMDLSAEQLGGSAVAAWQDDGPVAHRRRRGSRQC